MIDIVYNLDSDIKSRDTMEFHRPHRPQTQPPRPICPNCDVVCCDFVRPTDFKMDWNPSQVSTEPFWGILRLLKVVGYF